jgi:hypothetical protein
MKEIILKYLNRMKISFKVNPAITFFGLLTVSLDREISLQPKKWDEDTKEEIADFLKVEINVSLQEFIEYWLEESKKHDKKMIIKVINEMKKNREIILNAIQDMHSDLRSELQKIENKLSTEKESSRLSKGDYNNKLVTEIESKPSFFRAVVHGPHFLHPTWLLQRRIKQYPQKSFSHALQNYLLDSIDKPERDIRLLTRNSSRYIKYLDEKQLVFADEISQLKDDMKKNLYKLFPIEKDNVPSFCCVDPDLFGLIIADKSCFIYSRLSKDTPIQEAYFSNDDEMINTLSNAFDDIFDYNFKGRKNEIQRLEEYIQNFNLNIKTI